MDKITLKNMIFYGYHGVLPEEQKLGQRFQVDLELYLDLTPAGKTDDLQATVNYAEVYDIVNKIMTTQTFKLLEAAAYHIIEGIKQQFPQIQGITLEIRKPSVPIAGCLDYAAITKHWGQV